MSRTSIVLLLVAATAQAAQAQLLRDNMPGVRPHAVAASAAIVESRQGREAVQGMYLHDNANATNRYRRFMQDSGAAQEQVVHRTGGFPPLWLAPIFSAVLPGAGQLRLGEERFAAYMAVEAYGWIRFARHRADARRERDGYRDLAADVARALFTNDAPIGDFEYYERMEKFTESGVFDASEAVDLQPDPNEATFNGALWKRARETFWANPDVQPPVSSRAWTLSIEYYAERAVTDEYRWSWANANLEYDLFKRTIAGSNAAFRRSVQDLGVILGNHVLSMVDALVAVRLRAATAGSGATRSYSLSATIPLRSPEP